MEIGTIGRVQLTIRTSFSLKDWSWEPWFGYLGFRSTLFAELKRFLLAVDICFAMGVKPTVVLRAATAAGFAAAAKMGALFKAAGGVKMGAVGAAMAAAAAATGASGAPKKEIEQH